MLEQDDLTYKGVRIPCWRYEPKRPRGTIIYIPGFETRGPMYEEHLHVFSRYRILLPELYEGSHPVASVQEAINLVMTLYRHKSKEIDLTQHRLTGYSVGGLIAAHLAADCGVDHPPARDLTMISPAIPDLGMTISQYELAFVAMGTRLRLGSEGESGMRFAKKNGLQFMYHILRNYERDKRLLESVNNATIPPGAITIPTRVLLSKQDEFFPVQKSLTWLERTCTNPRVDLIAGSHARILHAPQEANDILRKSKGK